MPYTHFLTTKIKTKITNYFDFNPKTFRKKHTSYHIENQELELRDIDIGIGINQTIQRGIITVQETYMK